MKVLSFGAAIVHPDVSSKNFFSNDIFHDADLLLIDPTAAFQNHLKSLAYLGPILPYEQLVKIKLKFNLRLKEFEEFLALNRPAIVFPGQLASFKTYSGSGTLITYDPSADFPIGTLKQVEQNGLRLDFSGPTWAQAFSRKYEELFQYRTTVKAAEYDLTVLWTIKGTSIPIGGIQNVPNRWIFFSPTFKTPNLPNEFFEELFALYQTSLRPQEDPKLPKWHIDYCLPSEQGLRHQKIELKEKILGMEDEMAGIDIRMSRIERRKLLFCGKGDLLCDVVAETLSALGLATTPGPEGRDDLVATFESMTFVVEVKGRDSSSAGERDAAQLEKWVSRFFEESGQQPKGLLVVNGWKDTPLSERNQPVFPDQMLEYSKRRGHCLISGIQLLCLSCAVDNGEVTKQDAILSLHRTIGPFPDYLTDWNRFIN